MPAIAQHLNIPLPKGWPRRVRSAVIHVISLAHFSLTSTRSWAANSWNSRIRLKQHNHRLRQELALLREEMRIKDARMQRIPPQCRPHYPPTERLAILELRAARGWTLSQTARRLLVTPATVSSWMSRLDEEGPRATLRVRQPVNKFPEFVHYIVQRLKLLCPTLGRVKIAQILCRAGLHLGSTTVCRMLRESPERGPLRVPEASARVLSARTPNHVWHFDLTTVPTSLGLWSTWLPFALPQRWPFCWWLALTVDHFSRRLMGFDVFRQQPNSTVVRAFLGRTLAQGGTVPKYLITDQGKQFTGGVFRGWCRRRGIRQRFGAVGKYGSIAVAERLIRTTKDECTRRLLVPYDLTAFRRELALYAAWYNDYRPHTVLEGRTPNEVYHGQPGACSARRFEPRKKWPRGSPCAKPQTAVRGPCGVRLGLSVSYLSGHTHLPIIELKRAA